MVKRISLIFLMMFLATGCAEGFFDVEYAMVSPEQALVMMAEAEDYIILDVRTQEEYAAGHIPGAICVPNETIGRNDIPALPDKEQLIFIYCRSGNRSKQAADKLMELGYTQLVEFGGIQDWPGDVVTDTE